jgi:predicted nucleotidyltransferase
VSTPRYDPERTLKKLLQHHVKFVVIGGVAAALHGSPMLTADVDISYERSPGNLERLAAALAEMNARLRGIEEDLPFDADARALESGSNFTFATDLGDLDVIGWPDGISSYAELVRAAVPMRIGRQEVRVASIDDLIRMKRAAGRPKDIAGALALEEVKRQLGG